MLNRFQAAEMVCLDVGTNTRVQIRKLFGPSRYPFAKLLNKSIGAKRNESNELCAIGIEMNPSHTADCQPIEKHYNSKCCHRVRIFTETAATVCNGSITFFSDDDKQHQEWGASTQAVATQINK